MASPPRTFSKSKLMAYLQCEKRLWLDVHRPDLREDSAESLANFATGHSVGEVARSHYDPKGQGQFIDVTALGIGGALQRTVEVLKNRKPVFEAGFSVNGALAFADVLLPVTRSGRPHWRMVEVKASTEVKEYHRNDVAVQAYVARKSGLPLAGLSLAHIDSSWVYPGGGDYDGLLVEEDLTAEAFAREKEVEGWITVARTIAARRTEPAIRTGLHCNDPYACGFIDHCTGQEPQEKFPAFWLPRIQSKALRKKIHEDRVTDLRKIPDDLLNPLQLRVKTHTLARTVLFDAAGAAAALAPHGFPACFLDFETVNFGVPIWKGTRPYQQIPFQFSLHRLSRLGKLTHEAFLDVSGEDPSRAFAEQLLTACGEGGPVYVYNQSFEAGIIKGLGERFSRLKRPLEQIITRMVDLLPIAREHYYHHEQQGSWSIKAVLLTILPELGYDNLDGVQDGGMAVQAFTEAISDATTADRKAALRAQLEAYCKHDTYALVRLWQHFTGRTKWAL